MVDEIERAGDIELLDRRPIVQQGQKLDLGRAQIHRGRFEVGLELDALQLQAIEVHLGQIARLEAVAIHGELAIPIVQVLPGILSHRFRLQRLHKGVSQVEKQRAVLIRVGGGGDIGGLLCACQAQLPFVLALMQIADRPEGQRVGQGPVDGIPGDGRSDGRQGIDLIERPRELRVGPKVSRDLGGAGLIDIELGRLQGRIRRLELIPDLLPGKRRLGQGHRRQKPRHQNRTARSPA